MSSRSRHRPSTDYTLTKAINNTIVIFLWAFCTEFSPDTDQFIRLQRQVASVRDSVLSGALTIGQVRKALKDEYGVTV